MIELKRDTFRRALQGVGAPPAPRFYQMGAAVAVVLRFDEQGGDPEVLLMRRVEHKGDPWSGHVSLPGGRAEPQDSSVAATATRETQEEVNLDLRRDAELVGHLPPTKPMITLKLRPLHVSPVVYFATAPLAPRAQDEAQRVFWLPLQQAHAGDLEGRHRYHLGPVSRVFPCWRYEGEVIWGLTLRVLRGLLARVERTGDASI